MFFLKMLVSFQVPTNKFISCTESDDIKQYTRQTHCFVEHALVNTIEIREEYLPSLCVLLSVSVKENKLFYATASYRYVT